jgi:hypothetical protein
VYTFSECPNIAVWLVVPCRMPGFDDRPRESPPDPAPGSWSTGSAGATGPGRLKTLASSMMWPRIGGRTGSRIGGRVGDRVGHPATATQPAHSRCSDTPAGLARGTPTNMRGSRGCVTFITGRLDEHQSLWSPSPFFSLSTIPGVLHSINRHRTPARLYSSRPLLREWGLSPVWPGRRVRLSGRQWPKGFRRGG